MSTGGFRIEQRAAEAAGLGPMFNAKRSVLDLFAPFGQE
jgi:hypothetical protein